MCARMSRHRIYFATASRDVTFYMVLCSLRRVAVRALCGASVLVGVAMKHASCLNPGRLADEAGRFEAATLT